MGKGKSHSGGGGGSSGGASVGKVEDMARELANQWNKSGDFDQSLLRQMEQMASDVGVDTYVDPGNIIVVGDESFKMSYDAIEDNASRLADWQKNWQDAARVDMGANVNPLVREMNDFSDAIMDQYREDKAVDGLAPKMLHYSFDKGGQLIKNLNGYQSNTGDYDMHISQSLDLHGVTMTTKSYTNFMEYMNDRVGKDYGDYARSQLKPTRKKRK